MGKYYCCSVSVRHKILLAQLACHAFFCGHIVGQCCDWVKSVIVQSWGDFKAMSQKISENSIENE